MRDEGEREREGRGSIEREGIGRERGDRDRSGVRYFVREPLGVLVRMAEEEEEVR